MMARAKHRWKRAVTAILVSTIPTSATKPREAGRHQGDGRMLHASAPESNHVAVTGRRSGREHQR